MEGTPVFRDVFVLSTREGCSVTQFFDYSLDYWGGCKVLRMDCPSVAAAMSRDTEGAGCTSTVLASAHPCEAPF